MLGTKILEERQSKYNGRLKVVRTLGFGTYIQSDGLTQSGGVVESIWKNTLNNLPKLNYKNCLILGLGGGTVSKIVFSKFGGVRITGIEIDPLMVDLGKKYLKLEEKNQKIIIDDAFKSSEIEKKYDLVIVDLYNGDSFPKKFESPTFLKKLLIHKVVVINRLYYKDKKEKAEMFFEKLKKVFKNIKIHYPPANIMFIISNYE